MSKRKIVVPNQLLTLAWVSPGYVLQVADQEANTKNLMLDSNNDVTVCFDDKKDKRNSQKKDLYPIALNFNFLLPLKGKIQSDFTFNQLPSSSTRFNISSFLNNLEIPKSGEFKNTFKFDGCFKNIELNQTFPFNSAVINYNNKFYQKSNSPYSYMQPEHRVVLNNLTMENFTLNNCIEKINFHDITTKNLKKLDLKNNFHVSFPNLYALNIPNAKTIDLTNCESINYPQYNMFYSLDFDFSDSEPESDKSINLLDEFKDFQKHVNLNADIIISPTTKITCGFLPINPNSSDNSSTWTLQEYLGLKSTEPFHTTPLKIINHFYNKKKQNYENNIKQMETFFSHIGDLVIDQSSYPDNTNIETPAKAIPPAQKMIFIPNFYEMTYTSSANYELLSCNKENLKNIIRTKDANWVLNFEDKKDRRQLDTKKWSNAIFNTNSFFCDSIPYPSFTFNQDKLSPTSFNLNIGATYGYYIGPEFKIDKDSTFTFNGNFYRATLGRHCQFKKVNLNHNSEYKSNHFYKYVQKIDIKNECQIEELNVTNKVNNINFSAKSKTLNLVRFECPSIDIDISSFEIPNIKNIDFSKIPKIAISSGFWDFNGLDFDFKQVQENSEKVQKHLKSGLKSFANHINPNANILLSPDSLISLPFLQKNRDYEDSRLVKVSDLFKFDSNKPQSFKALDFIKKMYELKLAITKKQAALVNNKIKLINESLKKQSEQSLAQKQDNPKTL